MSADIAAWLQEHKAEIVDQIVKGRPAFVIRKIDTEEVLGAGFSVEDAFAAATAGGATA